MPRTLRDVYHTPIFSAKKAKLKRRGRVVEALFDQKLPVVVGYLVERPRIFYVWDRKDVHLAADSIKFIEDGILVPDMRKAFDKAAESRLKIDWANTVIFSGMPVQAANGTRLGVVRDGAFNTKTGRLETLVIGGGIAETVALGTREIAGEHVRGYVDGCVVVEDVAIEAELEGGAATIAGRGAAVAKVRVEQSTAAAVKAAKTAAVYGKAAAKVASESETGKKALGWLKSLRDEVVDAMGPPEDDD